jgi:hypothetical protein
MTITTDSRGSDTQVRFSETLSGLASAPLVPGITDASWDFGRKFEHVPLGNGFGFDVRVVETGKAPSISVTRNTDAETIVNNDVFTNALDQSSKTVSAKYVEIRNLVTGRACIAIGAKGSVQVQAPYTDFVTETWDALCEELIEFAF